MTDERIQEAGRSGRAALRAGLMAGAIGALVKVGYMVLAALVLGKPAFQPLRPLGATFRGEDVVLAGVGSLLYGLVLLVVVSAALGAIFALLLPADYELGGAALLGVGYALFVMAVITSGVLPEANPLLRYRMPNLGGTWVIAASLWGAVLGILVQRLRHRAPQGRAAGA